MKENNPAEKKLSKPTTKMSLTSGHSKLQNAQKPWSSMKYENE